MPKPEDVTLERYRERMRAYGADTGRHFEPGADLEPRYLTVAPWVPRDSRVLDIGCNSGACGKRLHNERGCEMWGVEPNPDLARIAVMENGYRGVSIGLIEDVADEVVRLCGQFEVVIAMDPLDYATDLEGCMAVMLKCVRPGGLLIGEGVHRRGMWGDPRRHTDLVRSWTAETARQFVERYLTDVEVVEVARRGETQIPQWVFWYGVKP